MTTDQRLASIVERIEALRFAQMENREAIADAYTEAKSAGYDPAALREVIKLRAKGGPDAALESLVATYMNALGGP